MKKIASIMITALVFVTGFVQSALAEVLPEQRKGGKIVRSGSGDWKMGQLDDMKKAGDNPTIEASAGDKLTNLESELKGADLDPGTAGDHKGVDLETAEDWRR